MMNNSRSDNISLHFLLGTSNNGRQDQLNVYQVVCITIAITAFLLNSSLCVLHACCKRLRRNSNIFLVTHYLANTFQTLGTMVFVAWLENTDALLCIINVSFSCSVLCIPVISTVSLFKTQWVHRCIVCVSGNLSYVLVTILLCTGAGVALPPFLGWGSPILFFKFPTSISLSYSIFSGIVLTVIPLTVICFTNYKIVSRVRSYEQRARRQTEPNCLRVGRAQFEQRRRDGEAKLVVILQVLIFVVCFVPTTVESVLASCSPHTIPEVLKYSLNCFAQAYCAMSPILYGFTNREVRQALKCCCYRKTFVIENPSRKKAPQLRQTGEGRYCVEPQADAFVIQRAEHSNDELSVADFLDCGGRVRFVRFVGLAAEFSTSVAIDNVSRPQKPVGREKRPITTEVSPIRRHSTIRKQEEAPRVRKRVDESTKVRFDSETEYTDKERKKFIATPSVKRMRQIKKTLTNISYTDLQSSVASLTGSEFELQQHKAPHFTNYSDPMRSAGFRQVLTGKGKMKRTYSLHRRDKYKPNTTAFMERRCSTEGDKAIRTASYDG